MKIALIIPAHNEERRIRRTLEEYGSFFEDLRRKKKLKYEIIVVINASTDSTKEIVSNMRKNNKNINYLDLKRGGKGYAVIEGFKEALKRQNDLIGFVDADMATPPESFYDLIKNLEYRISEIDGVIASRYIPGSEVNPKPTIRRRIVSRIFNYLVRGLFLMPYRDTQCGAKIFKKTAIVKTIPGLSMSQWAFDVELLYTLRKLGYIIKEVPTKWSDQEYSKINFLKAGPFMGLSIIRLRLLNSYLYILVRFYDKFLGLVSR